MADRVLRERRAPIPKSVAFEVVFGDLFDCADPLIPPVLDTVEAFFQFRRFCSARWRQSWKWL
jgi:hypothetical protein